MKRFIGSMDEWVSGSFCPRIRVSVGQGVIGVMRQWVSDLAGAWVNDLVGKRVSCLVVQWFIGVLIPTVNETLVHWIRGSLVL